MKSHRLVDRNYIALSFSRSKMGQFAMEPSTKCSGKETLCHEISTIFNDDVRFHLGQCSTWSVHVLSAQYSAQRHATPPCVRPTPTYDAGSALIIIITTQLRHVLLRIQATIAVTTSYILRLHRAAPKFVFLLSASYFSHDIIVPFIRTVYATCSAIPGFGWRVSILS